MGSIKLFHSSFKLSSMRTIYKIWDHNRLPGLILKLFSIYYKLVALKFYYEFLLFCLWCHLYSHWYIKDIDMYSGNWKKKEIYFPPCMAYIPYKSREINGKLFFHLLCGLSHWQQYWWSAFQFPLLNNIPVILCDVAYIIDLDVLLWQIQICCCKGKLCNDIPHSLKSQIIFTFI